MLDGLPTWRDGGLPPARHRRRWRQAAGGAGFIGLLGGALRRRPLQGALHQGLAELTLVRHIGSQPGQRQHGA